MSVWTALGVSILSVLLFKASFFLLIFCLDVVSITACRVLESITVLLSVFASGSANVCFTHFGLLMLAHIFLWLLYLLYLIVLSSCDVLLCLLWQFLKFYFILFIYMAIPTLFQLLFKWSIFFYPLAFDLHVSLNIKQGSYRQHLAGFFSFMKVILCIM